MKTKTAVKTKHVLFHGTIYEACGDVCPGCFNFEGSCTCYNFGTESDDPMITAAHVGRGEVPKPVPPEADRDGLFKDAMAKGRVWDPAYYEAEDE